MMKVLTKCGKRDSCTQCGTFCILVSAEISISGPSPSGSIKLHINNYLQCGSLFPLLVLDSENPLHALHRDPYKYFNLLLLYILLKLHRHKVS
jgi:hypothetical protein